MSAGTQPSFTANRYNAMQMTHPYRNSPEQLVVSERETAE